MAPDSGSTHPGRHDESNTTSPTDIRGRPSRFDSAQQWDEDSDAGSTVRRNRPANIATSVGMYIASPIYIGEIFGR